jgi:hypothetical protein
MGKPSHKSDVRALRQEAADDLQRWLSRWYAASRVCGCLRPLPGRSYGGVRQCIACSRPIEGVSNGRA